MESQTRNQDMFKIMAINENCNNKLVFHKLHIKVQIILNIYRGIDNFSGKAMIHLSSLL